MTPGQLVNKYVHFKANLTTAEVTVPAGARALVVHSTRTNHLKLHLDEPVRDKYNNRRWTVYVPHRCSHLLEVVSEFVPHVSEAVPPPSRFTVDHTLCQQVAEQIVESIRLQVADYTRQSLVEGTPDYVLLRAEYLKEIEHAVVSGVLSAALKQEQERRKDEQRDALMADIRQRREGLRRASDPYVSYAASLFGVPADQVTEEMRDAAKSVMMYSFYS